MPMIIDGCATNGNLDSSGEILNVAGHDISDLIEGKGVLNWEHEKGSEDILGAITYAKKIMAEKDCEDDRQKMYWKLSNNSPYVYIKAELFDDEEHPGSVAAAALIRYYAKRNEKLLCSYSIEGQTLERDGNKLQRSVGRRVALTLRACNKSCVAGLLSDPKSKGMVEKSEGTIDGKLLYEVDSIIFNDDYVPQEDAWLDLKKSIDLLNKTLTAGGGGCAPGQLAGGAALVREDAGLKNRVRAVFRDWDRMRPLKDAIKAALPEVSDEYLNHFVTLADELSLKKGLPAPKLLRIGIEHSDNPHANDDQKKLIEGVYLNQANPIDPGHRDYCTSEILKGRNDAGDDVVIKPHVDAAWPPPSPAASGPHNATHYYQLADKVFGMGNHVPATNHFSHPSWNESGKSSQVQKFLKDAQPALLMSNARMAQLAGEGRANGSLHKLFLMDAILGADFDRHVGNIMIGQDGTFHHIDNDGALDHKAKSYSAYLGSGFKESPLNMSNDTIHMDAKAWLDGISPVVLGKEMKKYGINKHAIKNAISALSVAKKMSSQGAPMSAIREAIGAAFQIPQFDPHTGGAK